MRNSWLFNSIIIEQSTFGAMKHRELTCGGPYIKGPWHNLPDFVEANVQQIMGYLNFTRKIGMLGIIFISFC